MANDNYIKLIKEVGTAMGGMRSNNMHKAHEYICVYITNVVTHTHTYILTHANMSLCAQYIYMLYM